MAKKEATTKNSIKSERVRTNILKHVEFKTITWLCERMPAWVTPNILTAIGLIGAAMVFASLYFGVNNKNLLWIGVLGFLVNWFGDSLDGRLAYYRNIPRKWYGWALDINIDWLAIAFIGLGFYAYLPSYKIMAFVFVIGYGGIMITSMVRYKITDKYSIDSGLFGPTEVRVLLIGALIAEMLFSNVLFWFAIVISPILVLLYFKEISAVIKLGDERDIAKRKT